MNFRDFINSEIRLSIKLLLSLLSGLLLGLPFLFPSLYLLTWFAFVPLLLALYRANFRQAYMLGLICGLSLSICAVYWIDEFIYNLKGYSGIIRTLLSILFWFYSAHLLAVITILLQVLRKLTKLSDFLLFPILVCVCFSAYPLLFSIQIGISQSHFLIGIQAIEITGAYGLDYVIALANLLIFKLLLHSKEKILITCATVMIAIWFSFGILSLSSQIKKEALWDIRKIGIVQPNEKPSINVPPPDPNYSFAYSSKIAMTQALANEGASVVIWPESRFQGYFRESHVTTAFQYYAKNFNTNIIFQDMERVMDNGEFRRFNSSVFIDKNGQEKGRYRKRKLVPIGEYLPLFSETPVIKSIVKSYFGDFFSDYASGEKSAHYKIDDISFLPFICYEIMFPQFVAKALPDNTNGKILVAQSNNTWFGDTRQPYQHLYASILRSIENRTPMVHVLNNGPSAIAMPSGKIIFQSSYKKADSYVIDIPIAKSHQKTLFSRYPGAFINITYIIFVFFIVYGIWCFLIRNRI